jgi:GGDEF domain-containing protein
LFSVEKSFSPAMRLGSSIGLVHLPGESVPKLGKLQILKLADQLMYQAKQSGVNCLCALQHVFEK